MSTQETLAYRIKNMPTNLDDISEAELGAIDGVIPGTAAANKALVLNASKGISTITSATITTLTSTTVEAPTVTNASLVLESLNPMTVKLNDTNALQLDNAAISGFAAAADTHGTPVYIESQDGGVDTALDGGSNSGLISIKVGEGSAGGADFSGGHGRPLTLTSGVGGAGGAHTSNDPDGGDGADIELIAGSGGAAGAGGSGFAGKPGKVKVQAGTFAHTNAQTINMADATAVLTLVPGTPTGTLMTSNVLYVDAQSTGTTEILTLPAETDASGMTLYIHNTGGENITIKDDGDAQVIGFLAPDDGGVFYCNGTAWQGGALKQNMTGVFRQSLFDVRGLTYQPLAASEGSGLHYIATGTGSGPVILGEISNHAASGDSETSYSLLYVKVPMNYIAGQSFVVRFKAGVFTAGGTVSTATIDLLTFLFADDGTYGGDICATAVQTLAVGAPADFDFTITPTTITPGSILFFQVITVVSNNNSTNCQAEISDIEIRCTINN